MKKTRKTPVQQLMPMLNPKLQHAVTSVLVNLKVEVAEDLCLSLVAYLRFGLYRKFDNDYLQLLYIAILTLIENPDLTTDNHHSNR